MVLRLGGLLAGAGVFLGLVASYAATRVLSGFLYGVDPADSVTYATVSLTLTVIAMLASYLPARRAARVDPIEVLRAE